MSLPTLDKTWIFKPNILLPSTGNQQYDYARLILTIKNALTSSYGWVDSSGSPTTNSHLWTVPASSNSVTASTNDNWGVYLQGTDTSASVNTSTNNTLRIRVGTSLKQYTTVTVTAGATTAKTTIVSDLNAAFTAAGLSTLQASITGTNQLIISDIGGCNAYIEIDTIANGSTLGTSCGFTSGGMNTTNCLIWNTNFSWIVLQQSQINTNYQVCYSTSTINAYYRFSSYVSPAAGFGLTGLVTTAVPTAIDRIQFHVGDGSGINGIGSNAFDQVLHVAMSTDGQCTRVIGFNSSNMRTFWLYDKPKNPVSGWTNPAITLMVANSGTTIPTAYTQLNDNAQIQARINGMAVGLYASTEFYGAAALGENILFPNTLTGEYLMTPCGLACGTSGAYGRHGEIYDLWWTSTSVYAGETFPGSSTRQFACLNCLVHPWNNSAMIIA